MNERVRLVLGLLVISVGVFWNQILERIPDINLPNNVPIISIPQPSDSVLGKVSSLAELVTDDSDRDSLGIFNHIFATRLESYNADSQQFNDIYVGAAKEMYGDTLKGKYDGFAEGIVGLMQDTLGTDNHSVTKDEKQELSENFDGLAYSLVN